jgi:hypothetical protein
VAQNLLIKNQVPKIDDDHPDEEGTNDTVAGCSEAFSESTDELPQAQRRAQRMENVVDCVPAVEVEKARDVTSAAYAVSETGQYPCTEDHRQSEGFGSWR